MSERTFTPALFGMSMRQYLALGLACVGSGVAAVGVDMWPPARFGGLYWDYALTSATRLGPFVAAGFAAGALIGAVLSIPIGLVFHYATPKTRGIVRFVVILGSGAVAATWLSLVSIAFKNMG